MSRTAAEVPKMWGKVVANEVLAWTEAKWSFPMLSLWGILLISGTLGESV